MAAEAAFSPPNRDAGSTATGETVTVRCGELHCQKDSFARELRTTVLGCQKSTVKADIGKLWEVRFKELFSFQRVAASHVILALQVEFLLCG